METIEVEVKARLENREHVEQEIIRKGAVLQEEKYQHDILLDPPQADFAKSDQVLRIRNTNGIWKLDYKTPRLDQETKSRKEFSIKIDNGETLKDIFSWMDFKVVGEIEKRRKAYRWKNMTINFDEVTNLGSFIEVEILAPESEFAAAKQDIFSLLAELSITETIKKDYLELLWEKGFFKKN